MKKNRIGMGILAGALMLMVALFTASPAKAESHWSIGIGVGPGYYAPPPVIYRPVYPGPGYYWTDGYYDPYGLWVEGFWAPRAYVRPYGYDYGYGYGYAPRFYGGSYYGVYRRGFDRDDRRHFDRDDFRGRGNAFGHRR